MQDLEDNLDLRSPTFEDVVEATDVLRGKAVVTPVLESPELNERSGGRLLFKAESLQRTGSYKFRGAYNRLSRLDADERRRGIVAFSTGNFGQSIAAAAKMLGIDATVIVPTDVPQIKVENIRAAGADVQFYERARRNHREEIAAKISAERGATVIPPGDDPHVVAGYGTCGYELAQQVEGAIDAVLVPCGGGGLSAGIGVALAGLGRATKLYPVEPERFDDVGRSLRSGKRTRNEPGPLSLCDALLAPLPSMLPFRMLKQHAAGALTVSDAHAAEAMRLAFRYLKLVLEPGGAVAVAAAMCGQFDCRGKTVAVICSGAGVDAKAYSGILAST